MSSSFQPSTSASSSQPGPGSPTTNPLFLQGLQSILAPLYARGASEAEIAEVTARAEVFFAQSQAATPAAAPPSPPTALPTPPPAPASSAPGNPPYPLSFAALASLIASGAPIPGIRDIPDKLAEGEPSVSTVDVAAVRKPWEVEKEDVVLGSDGITGDGSGKMIEGE